MAQNMQSECKNKGSYKINPDSRLLLEKRTGYVRITATFFTANWKIKSQVYETVDPDTRTIMQERTEGTTRENIIACLERARWSQKFEETWAEISFKNSELNKIDA